MFMNELQHRNCSENTFTKIKKEKKKKGEERINKKIVICLQTTHMKEKALWLYYLAVAGGHTFQKRARSLSPIAIQKYDAPKSKT